MERLEQLARRLAEEARDGGEVQIRKPLNSFERRVVHMAVADIEGVESHSVGDGDDKRIVITREGQAPSQA